MAVSYGLPEIWRDVLIIPVGTLIWMLTGDTAEDASQPFKGNGGTQLCHCLYLEAERLALSTVAPHDRAVSH